MSEGKTHLGFRFEKDQPGFWGSIDSSCSSACTRRSASESKGDADSRPPADEWLKSDPVNSTEKERKEEESERNSAKTVVRTWEKITLEQNSNTANFAFII